MINRADVLHSQLARRRPKSVKTTAPVSIVCTLYDPLAVAEVSKVRTDPFPFPFPFLANYALCRVQSVGVQLLRPMGRLCMILLAEVTLSSGLIASSTSAFGPSAFSLTTMLESAKSISLMVSSEASEILSS
jgi:hypothetical protein